MTPAARIASDVEQRRTRVEGNRVACSRIGVVDLDRCLECLYLIRLDDSDAEPATRYVVCSCDALEAEVDFAW